MRNEFMEIAHTDYDLFSNNCATTVQRVMVKAGIPVSKPTYKASYKSYSTDFGMIDVYDGEKMECDINILPKCAYKSIKKYNPEGQIIRKN